MLAGFFEAVIAAIYRLIKYGGARRVLFLVGATGRFTMAQFVRYRNRTTRSAGAR